MNAAATGGCGSGVCACAGQVQDSVVASVNGVALHAPGERPDPAELRERAHAELLRQRAVDAGLLADTVDPLRPVAPVPDPAARDAIETLLDAEVRSPEPGEAECLRHYEAHRNRWIVGQALHVRHILFAVTPGVNVHALAQRAETALLELSRKDVPAGRFEQLAAELSNCPSGQEGGDLGWVAPEDCAPELANELFFQTDSRWGMGVHPRLVHTRFGLHIIEVLGRRKGTLPPFEAVRERIRAQLALQSRSTALRQYMRLLVGQAKIEGIELEGADSPLVQ